MEIGSYGWKRDIDFSHVPTTVYGDSRVLTGSLYVADAAPATKSYRFRTSGSALDLEFGGQSLYISGWTGADYTGTQRFFMQLDPSNSRMNFKSGFFPDVNNSQDMGATGNYWANLFCTTVLLNSTATLDGTSAGLVNLTGNLGLTGSITKYANATPANGQLLIGNTTNGTFSLATLTQGSNVTITTGPGTITIAAPGDDLLALNWMEVF